MLFAAAIFRLGSGASVVGISSYDVHPVDSRFLMPRAVTGANINVIANWLSDETMP